MIVNFDCDNCGADFRITEGEVTDDKGTDLPHDAHGRIVDFDCNTCGSGVTFDPDLI